MTYLVYKIVSCVFLTCYCSSQSRFYLLSSRTYKCKKGKHRIVWCTNIDHGFVLNYLQHNTVPHLIWSPNYRCKLETLKIQCNNDTFTRKAVNDTKNQPQISVRLFTYILSRISVWSCSDNHLPSHYVG